MAGVGLALEKLTDGLGGALELRPVGMSNDLVHSSDAQAGLGGQIIDDRADNAAQGRQLFQDEFGGKLQRECPLFPIAPTITSRHHSPNGLPSRSASSWRDRYCSSLTLQDIDRVRFF